ncbi:MAG: thioredoxin-disulfide reductase [Microgenomates group bacterium]
MIYDLIIIGAGPAGLTASIYASRYRINHLVIAKDLGGAMALASSVENYPGFERISGLELAQKMLAQAQNLGTQVKWEEVIDLRKKENIFEVETANGNQYQAKALILAMGTKRRELGVPGEKEYLGKGVSYCATCDAAFFKEKLVAVIGGANAAVMSADHLSRFASKVYLIYRKKPLRAEPLWRERVEKNEKIEIVYETNVLEILGDGKKVTGVKLDRPYQEKEILEVDGVFVEIGGVPGTELAQKLGVEVDEKGYIKVNSRMETNLPGVFAAGDIANVAGEFQQIVVAAGEGALAVTGVYKYLK